jgi:hypothetical protein
MSPKDLARLVCELSIRADPVWNGLSAGQSRLAAEQFDPSFPEYAQPNVLFALRPDADRL